MMLMNAMACTSVDQTEHCVETRYGNVVNERMTEGLNATFFTQATCFSLIDQNFPQSQDEAVTIAAQTGGGQDPVTIQGDVAVVFRFDPTTVYNLFLEKRSQEAALVEINNAIRDGYRTALAGWTVSSIFSEQRAALGDSVMAHIQRKLGDRAVITQVFVRDIAMPPAIEEARTRSAQQAQVLSQARQQYTIDSVNAASALMRSQAQATATRATAAAYEINPRLLDLEIAKEMAKLCGAATTCVLGASTTELLGLRGGGR